MGLSFWKIDLVPMTHARFAMLLLWFLVTHVPHNLRASEDQWRRIVGAARPSTDDAIYGEGVRSTPWLTPAQQQAGFHLPPGFEISLFAAEPTIAKPLNMAFDDRGRLWLTQTTRYPYPAPLDHDPAAVDQAADAVVVLEDRSGNGAADTCTTFADGLNIPIGVLPYGDGCLCFSIPYIWYLRDTTGDGRCDQRQRLLGPFDTTRDTHGMVNSLRDGGDGWIYACHGFNNQSTVAGSDGHAVTMHSGNTFRFRPDGSRIERVTRGQVNPFGLTQDDWGYWYSADCHSKPITQLVPGASYPSFGRSHDGLGFLPPMVDHLHGSTAISGILHIAAESPLTELRQQILSGNVMTSRINRNGVRYRGATAVGHELPDFLTSDDPWFRPVDLQLGPDHAIYVADFYNRIIGHYEVPLDHPGRDRTSGRIWKITSDNTSPPPALDRQTQAAKDRLTLLRRAAGRQLPVLARELLNDSNPHVARLAAERLGETGDVDDVERLIKRLDNVVTEDHVLRQSIRIALARLLRSASESDKVWSWVKPDGPVGDTLFDILPAVPRAEATAATLRYIQRSRDPARFAERLRQVAASATPQQLQDCMKLAQGIAGDDLAAQTQWLDVLWQARSNQATPLPDDLLTWMQAVASELWEMFYRAQTSAVPPPVTWVSDRGEPWPQQERFTNQRESVSLHSSFVWGETYTGWLRSDPFDVPAEISFFWRGIMAVPTRPISS